VLCITGSSDYENMFAIENRSSLQMEETDMSKATDMTTPDLSEGKIMSWCKIDYYYKQSNLLELRSFSSYIENNIVLQMPDWIMRKFLMYICGAILASTSCVFLFWNVLFQVSLTFCSNSIS